MVSPTVYKSPLTTARVPAAQVAVPDVVGAGDEGTVGVDRDVEEMRAGTFCKKVWSPDRALSANM